MTFYVIEKVRYDDLKQYTEKEVVKRDEPYLVVVNKHSVSHHAFDRLERIVSKAGYKYHNDYTAIEIFENNKNLNIGDIIEDNGVTPLPYRTYHSNVCCGEYFDGMLIRFIKF